MSKWWTGSTNRQNKLGAFSKLIETNIRTTTIRTRTEPSRLFVSPVPAGRGFSRFFPGWLRRGTSEKERPKADCGHRAGFSPAWLFVGLGSIFFLCRFWPKTKSPPSQTNKCRETETSPVRSVLSLLLFFSGHFCTKSVFSVGAREQKADYLQSKGYICVFSI